MKSCSQRPLILKKRKPSLPNCDSGSTPGKAEPRSQGNVIKQERIGAEECDKTGEPEIQIAIRDYSALPNAQEVAVPAKAEIQSILQALAVKGKPPTHKDPSKVNLINKGSGSPHLETGVFQSLPPSKDEPIASNKGTPEEEQLIGTQPWTMEESIPWASPSLGKQEGNSNEEAASCGLDNSLTNIQWLGKMASNGLSSCSVKKRTEKENQTPLPKPSKSEGSFTAAAATSSTLWREPFPERPPYSYMAMIQFAINSTEKKRMMLKDIYTWIEDHFPYFKHVAKPGWKNSVRHNLSLHDMFVRETSANGKIAFWTIHPEANRYLTLDQVFKQQKRPTLDLQKNLKGSKSEPQIPRHRIKPLLPRGTSYFIPIQFPANEPLFLQCPSTAPLPSTENVLSTVQILRGTCSAPKMLNSSGEPALLLPGSSVKEETYCSKDAHQSTAEDVSRCCEEQSPAILGTGQAGDRLDAGEQSPLCFPGLPVKEELEQTGEELSLCVHTPPVKQKRWLAAFKSSPQSVLVMKRPEAGRSRRKQHLALSSSEEPVLVLSRNSSSNPFPPKHNLSFIQEEPKGNSPDLACMPEGKGHFKSPVKETSGKLPATSSPNKAPGNSCAPLLATDQWSLAPFAKESNNVDFSPVRTSPISFLPFQDSLDLLGLNDTPPRPSLCNSPQRPLLTADASDMVSGILTSSPSSSKLIPELPGDDSLLEDLILDTMSGNWSTSPLDVSFPDTMTTWMQN